MGQMIKICAAMAVVWYGMLAVAAAEPIALKRGINLDIWDSWPGEERWDERAVLLPFPEWQRKIKSEDLMVLRQAGFDFVRMPVDPAPFLSPKTEPFRDALFLSVERAVDTITASGLKVVVDLHAIPAGKRSSGSERLAADPALFDRYVDLVREFAGILRDRPANQVAFEPMNEPLAGCDGNQATWAQMQKRLFAAARSSATRLTLILSGGCWSGAESLADIDPNSIADDNIIWTFHSYAPFLLTHQGATWAGDFIRYVSGIPYPPHGENADERELALEQSRQRIRAEAPADRRSGMLTYLDELVAEVDTAGKLSAMMQFPFETVTAWADRHGIDRKNILLGEFGMIRQEYGTPDVMNPQWRAAYVGDMIDLAEKSGFSWSIWGYGGAFGVVEEFDGRRAETNILDLVRKLGTVRPSH
ncbi:MAG: glycoside hydrolase family 5 protein [Rhizobiaceae bacterium]